MSEPQELRRLRADREAARQRILRAQAALEAQPEAPADGEHDAMAAWMTERDELEAERRAAIEAAREAERLLREAEGAAKITSDASLSSILASTIAGVEARVAARADELFTLPCASGRIGAEQAELVGDAGAAARALLAGSRACETAGAFKTCAFAAARWCPRARSQALYAAIAANIKASRIPKKQRRLLTQHFDRGAGRVALDPKAFDAFAVAEAVYTRRAATVPTLAGPVKLRGDETLLVYFGPTGRGKTVAASYLIARWGGLYLTAYDLAGVGQDPGTPTKAQLLAAPVLVLDQTGRQHRSGADYASRVLEWAIHQRHAEERLTVIVGNYDSQAQIEEDLDEVIASRIAEDGVCVHCLGDDARRAPR